MRPNILIMIADDATYNDLALYGGQNVRTPNIDHLAQQGLVFNRAYLPMAMCNPCRTYIQGCIRCAMVRAGIIRQRDRARRVFRIIWVI